MKLSREEQKLVKLIIGKDEREFFNFYQKYKLSVYNFLYKQIGNRHKAEELTQDVFLDFIESLRNFRGESSLKTFLFSITRNKLIDFFRRKKIKQLFFSSLPYYLIEGLATTVLDEELENKELARKIKKVFQKLPNGYSLILRLKYIERDRVKAIAQRLSMSFKATESLLFRARRAFAKVFKNLP